MPPLNDLLQNLKMLIAGAQKIPDDVCVACDATSVTVLAEGVYRCDSCGYEGGSGYAAWQQGQRDEGLLALAPERRQELAREKLEQALRLLLSADGDANAGHHDLLGVGERFERASVGVGLVADIALGDHSVSDGDYQQQVGAELQIMEADALANDAFLLLYGQRDDPATAEAPGYVRSFLDLRLEHSMGNMGMMAQRVSNKAQIRTLRQAIERTLSEAFG